MMRELCLAKKYDAFRLLDPSVFNITKVTDNEVVIIGEKKKLYISTLMNTVGSNLQGIAHIDMRKEPEHILIERLSDFGFTIPHTIYTNEFLDYQGFIKKDTRYAVKSLYSARSMGKAVTDSDGITAMIEFLWLSEDNEENKVKFYDTFIKYPGELRNEEEKHMLYDRISSGNIYIQEYVENIKNEYRVIYARGTKAKKFLIDKRINYGIEDMVENYEVPYDIKVNPDDLPISILEKIKAFGDLTGKPFLSFDIYTTTDGTIGLFEYSTEFFIGYKGSRFFTLRKHLTKGMKIVYDEIMGNPLKNKTRGCV